jgi:hypothetical protein
LCGTHAIVDLTASPSNGTRWSCLCPDCYDPTPQSEEQGPGPRSTCLGYGATPEQAIAAWWEQVELAWEIDYLPNTVIAELSEQVNEERARTEGWALRKGVFDITNHYWGPSLGQIAGEP